LDLVPLSREHAPLLEKWENDMEVLHYWGQQPFPRGLRNIEETLDKLYERKDSLIVGIQLKDGRLIGSGGLSYIEWPWRRAELSMCIGEKGQQGHGYGREATRLILAHAFSRLNLHSVMLRVISYNKRAIRCYVACGFKPAGKRRESRMDGTRYYDVLLMDILDREFNPAMKTTFKRRDAKRKRE